MNSYLHDRTEQAERDHDKACAEPFSRHDARRASTLLAPLLELNERILALTTGMAAAMGGIADKLEEHADRIHGTLTPAGDKADKADAATPRPAYGPGALGDVMRSLDLAEETFSRHMARLAMQAGRNCTLA